MFDLNNIISSAQDFKAQKILVYGPPGLGKTTFACTFEAPVLLRVEDGAAALDVPTFPELIKEYAELCDCINALHGEHQYKTLVVDSLDWLEPIIWAETCDRLTRAGMRTKTGEAITSIEQAGYGKGYVEADRVWRKIIGGFDSLRIKRGMNLVMVAHAEQKRIEPPDSDPYDRYQIKLHKRAWAIWQEWVDMLLFATYERSLVKTKDGGPGGEDKHRAKGTGNRQIYTDERPAFLAKNRWSLPHEIFIGQDKTWSGFHQALNTATGGRYPLPTNNHNPQEEAA